MSRDYRPSASQSSIQSLAAAYTDSDESESDEDPLLIGQSHKRRKSRGDERRSSGEKRRSDEVQAPSRRDFYEPEDEEAADLFVPPNPYSPAVKNDYQSPYIDDSPIGKEPPPPQPNKRSESPETPTPAGSSLAKKNSSLALVNYMEEDTGEPDEMLSCVTAVEFRVETDGEISDELEQAEVVDIVTAISSNKNSEDLDVHDYLERTFDGRPADNSQNSTPDASTAEPEEILIPPAPQCLCDPKLQAALDKHMERKLQEGYNLNSVIQRNKGFRNPSIYEKLIDHLSIDEIGSNFSKDVFDPHGFRPCDFYDELSKAQKVVMDKWEKDRQPLSKLLERTPGNLALIEESKRKSRWGNTAAASGSLTHSVSSGHLPGGKPTPPVGSAASKLKSSDKERHGSAEKSFGYTTKKPKLVL